MTIMETQTALGLARAHSRDLEARKRFFVLVPMSMLMAMAM